MHLGKVAATLVACTAAGVAALYGSGYLTLMLLGVDAAPSWDTWWRYTEVLGQPAWKPHAWRIYAGGALGIGVPALLLLGALFVTFRSTKKTLYGDARFATANDLARQGMFDASETSLVVGRMGHRLIQMSGQQFAILAAPTRSGKGVGIVIPNLLTYAGSVVVLDIKQENFDLTSGWRARQGHDVHLFNPFAEDQRSSRWNPLHYVSAGVFRISDVMSIAETLYPDGSGDQKFWVSQARNAFVAFAMYLFEERDAKRRLGLASELAPEPTLGAIFRLSSGKGEEIKAHLRQLAAAPFLGDEAQNAFANLLSQEERTFSSIMGSFREPLNMFINPVMDAATSGNDFLLTDLRRRKMSIYIGIQPNKLGECRTIINLFFSQLIKLNTKELPQQNPALKHQCLLLMDEFTAIGRVDVLAHAVSFIAGYNLRLLPIIQSVSQLEAVYGADVARTLITNHALQIVYTPREQRDANEYSEMLGYTTVRKTSTTRGRDVSRSEADERRALMLPQELKAMDAKKEVFFYEGIPHPVMCDKIRYYEEKFFMQRLLPKVEPRTLRLGS
ncbi:type IV secretory system conjugative DNA transfer family protein [Luteibacter pinisoli]|uniref:Type IV secretory system conjugative DNA transfer family protein n=1 Tax=Luteibacter pinisoli TaxID=2589080 RepID=A0A4Y5Z940_9GAMM|nr:type IV secretory system conjugative DNA transfer family protein [Luteibacter pinisoli]QDE41486.1 type IV secretory system conjugative DNA transfer family protein [Luteibacter pinisoli]